jgi:CubicO group peptidase (beta-lactamase class C family)
VLPPRWESGGAGMVGTVTDYARFAEMLLEGGSLDGKRYLKTATVRLMTSDHVGKAATKVARDDYYFPGSDSGFGLGFAVRTVATGPLPVGEFRWNGVGGTIFFVDPRDDMLTVVMMQSPAQRARIEEEARQLVYKAFAR